MGEYFLGSKKLYYRTNELQEGRPTIVFVHGLSGSSSAWVAYEQELKQIANVVSFDLRGHGKSEKLRAYEAYKINNIADDLYELVEYLNIDQCILVGHSLGCLVVLSFLQRYQDRVSKIVLLAPSAAPGSMLSAKLLSPFLAIGVFIAALLPFSGRTVGGHVDYTRYRDTGDWNISRMIADIGNTSLWVYLYATKQAYRVNFKEFLLEISIPALIIHGKRDTIFPMHHGLYMASKIPGAQFLSINDADHILALNKSTRIIQEIKRSVLKAI